MLVVELLVAENLPGVEQPPIVHDLIVDGSQHMAQRHTVVQLAQPGLHSRIEIALQSEPHVQPAGIGLASGGDHRDVFFKLFRAHPNTVGKPVGQRAVTGEGDALEIPGQRHRRIVVRGAECMFAQGRVAMGLVEKRSRGHLVRLGALPGSAGEFSDRASFCHLVTAGRRRGRRWLRDRPGRARWPCRRRIPRAVRHGWHPVSG